MINGQNVRAGIAMRCLNPAERAFVDMFVRYRNVCHLSRILSEFSPLHYFAQVVCFIIAYFVRAVDHEAYYWDTRVEVSGLLSSVLSLAKMIIVKKKKKLKKLNRQFLFFCRTNYAFPVLHWPL